jgi:ethanolamine utilization microcompartment shell protein EutS
MKAKSTLAKLLPHGGVRDIAKKLGISPGTASTAIRRGSPGHPAVREALRIAEESGALAAAQQLANLSIAA